MAAQEAGASNSNLRRRARDDRAVEGGLRAMVLAGREEELGLREKGARDWDAREERELGALREGAAEVAEEGEQPQEEEGESGLLDLEWAGQGANYLAGEEAGAEEQVDARMMQH
ncbi:hypothetical protein OF846_004136 [Rhodotorula toruloides]|nr:hypothetical protein OF846_004136 [Rhodotorula toruloides]